jgi:glutathione synthase/RimK-type ligase-like ATP-grasp enzyme
MPEPVVWVAWKSERNQRAENRAANLALLSELVDELASWASVHVIDDDSVPSAVPRCVALFSETERTVRLVESQRPCPIVINSPDCVRVCRDYLLLSQRLRNARVGVPVRESGPVIVKRRLRHFRIENDEHCAMYVDTTEVPLRLQDTGSFVVEPLLSGSLIKLYVIGDAIYGADTPGVETQPPSAIVRTVRRAADAVGLETGGVDLIVTPETIVVIDVNIFCTYRVVPNRAKELASYMRRRLPDL